MRRSVLFCAMLFAAGCGNTAIEDNLNSEQGDALRKRPAIPAGYKRVTGFRTSLRHDSDTLRKTLRSAYAAGEFWSSSEVISDNDPKNTLTAERINNHIAWFSDASGIPLKDAGILNKPSDQANFLEIVATINDVQSCVAVSKSIGEPAQEMPFMTCPGFNSDTKVEISAIQSIDGNAQVIQSTVIPLSKINQFTDISARFREVHSYWETSVMKFDPAQGIITTVDRSVNLNNLVVVAYTQAFIVTESLDKEGKEVSFLIDYD